MGNGTVVEEKFFLKCEKCGKKLIERRGDGLLHFVFGKKKDADGNHYPYCPVDILIHGSIRIKCLSRACSHTTTFNYFPQSVPAEFSDESAKQ